MKRKFRHIWQEIRKRSTFIVVSLLLLGVSVLFTWPFLTGFSQSPTTLVIAIAAISALFTAISSIVGLMQATEIQRQRENQERPYIMAYFEGVNGGFLYLQIQNAGNSPAVDVTFKFEPDPIDSSGRNLSEISLFKKPISFMPPGKVYRQIIDAGHRFLADGRPTKYKIRIIYNSISEQMFDESIDFDLEYLKQSTVPGKTTEESLADIAKQLKDLTQIFTNTRGSIGGTNSFLIESPPEYKARLKAIYDERKELPRWKIIIRNMLENILEKISK